MDNHANRETQWGRNVSSLLDWIWQAAIPGLQKNNICAHWQWPPLQLIVAKPFPVCVTSVSKCFHLVKPWSNTKKESAWTRTDIRALKAYTSFSSILFDYLIMILMIVIFIISHVCASNQLSEWLNCVLWCGIKIRIVYILGSELCG